ncbi:NAD(P)/FAD-dependent oxidoreductase [Micromonospora chersina]|uniref:NAD(P)/FAD-dependent oxidoreductase n=1 Tax=Micromonospora chersina TaxID=47854 RepID=UPI0033E23F93
MVGGSVAGTLAARVLAEHYRQVVVVDRDEILGVSSHRRGAPHNVQAHGLHARGYGILAKLFPNLMEEAQALGLPVRDFGLMRWYFDGRPSKPAKTDLLSIAGNRPILENYLRSRVAALPNVTYSEKTELLGLVSTPDRRRVTGVRLATRADQPEEYQLDADLVVDATGRGSRLPFWLTELGYERPVEERMKINLAYTTRTYRRAPGTFDGPQAINPVASPDHPRGAFFGQTATGDCRLSLTGILGDHPPTEPEAFLEFARTLPTPDIHEAIRDAEPTSDAVCFKFPASVWRHYERLTQFPNGLLVLGDAIASFNPVYGQGMTVAAMEIEELRGYLAQHDDVDPLTVLGLFGKTIATPWWMSTTGDLDFPGVTGRRSLRVRAYNAYLGRVQYATTKDPVVTEAYMRVTGLIDPPRTLWKPRLMAKVLWLSRDRAAAKRRHPAPVPAPRRSAVESDPVDTPR